MMASPPPKTKMGAQRTLDDDACSPPPKMVGALAVHRPLDAVFSPPTSPYDQSRLISVRATMDMAKAVGQVVESGAAPLSLEQLLETAGGLDPATSSSECSLDSAIETARSFGAPTSLLVALSGSQEAAQPSNRLDLSSAATIVQRAYRRYLIRAQLKRAIAARYHCLVRDEDELDLDADAEMALLLILIEDAKEREEAMELDELQEALLEVELLRTEEAIAEAEWIRKFGDAVRREADNLSSLVRDQAASTIQRAYRSMVERQSHEYDGDGFEVDSSDEDDLATEVIEEEIEEGVANWAIDDVYAAGREPQGVAGASMLLAAASSKNFVALAVAVAAVHGGALGMSISTLLSDGSS
eukprot:COSAG02_NODE_5005_length_4726_cov_78.139615_6_plen_357_part_00